MQQAPLQEKVPLLYPEGSLPCLALAFAGNIASWKKKEGEQVGAGDEMAEIETDKATMAWESQDDGFIAKILLQEGAKDIPVGTPAMIFVEEEVCLCYPPKTN
jgi:pyruvate dehydrogenase E2 component (dihydrolipoamide acetyltransferase)